MLILFAFKSIEKAPGWCKSVVLNASAIRDQQSSLLPNVAISAFKLETLISAQLELVAFPLLMRVYKKPRPRPVEYDFSIYLVAVGCT